MQVLTELVELVDEASLACLVLLLPLPLTLISSSDQMYVGFIPALRQAWNRQYLQLFHLLAAPSIQQACSWHL